MVVNILGICSNDVGLKRCLRRALYSFHPSILLNDIMFSIADNLENVRQRIKKATISCGRPLASVQLLPVTKTRDAKTLNEAVSLGLNCFGENYLNEALEKQTTLAGLCSKALFAETIWHFIGPIQSNKTKAIAAHFDWVQSVDRPKIARRLSEQRPKDLAPLNVCIQVNINDEESKSGVSLEELESFAASIQALPGLCLRGLMAIPKAKQLPQERTKTYFKMQQAFQRLQSHYETVDTLSMGMSGDLDEAIAGGATMVRIGTALFGEREPN